MDQDQQETIDKIIRTVAGRKLAMFAAFKDIDRDDLIQETTISVMRALAAGSYDASRGALSTFVYTVASRSIIDIHRARTRTGERETKAAEMRPTIEMPIDLDPISEADETEERWRLPLAEFAAATYRKNIFVVPKKRPGRGPQHYSPILAATIIDLKRRTNTSYRGLQQVLSGNQELRRSLRIDRTPNYSTIQRFCCKCRMSPANKRAVRARMTSKGLDMAKSGCVIEVDEVCTEVEAAKAFGVHEQTLAQKRRAGVLPADLLKKNAITGKTQYVVKKIKEMVGAA